MKEMIILIAILSSLSTPTIIYANGCHNLNISIQNYTGTACTLLSHEVAGGNLNTDVIHTVPANSTSETMQMTQSLFSGPTIQMEYRCGQRTVTLMTHQNYCFLQAGDISGEIYTADYLHAKYTGFPGSFWHSLPGRMVWVLI